MSTWPSAESFIESADVYELHIIIYYWRVFAVPGIFDHYKLKSYTPIAPQNKMAWYIKNKWFLEYPLFLYNAKICVTCSKIKLTIILFKY